LHFDLKNAIEALGTIDDEIHGRKPRRPKGLRTGLFTRYVIDEGDRMAMDSYLKDTIVKIESVYKRY